MGLMNLTFQTISNAMKNGKISKRKLNLFNLCQRFCLKSVFPHLSKMGVRNHQSREQSNNKEYANFELQFYNYDYMDGIKNFKNGSRNTFKSFPVF